MSGVTTTYSCIHGGMCVRTPSCKDGVCQDHLDAVAPPPTVCNANNGQCPWQTRCKDKCKVLCDEHFMSPVKRLLPVGAVGDVAIVDTDTGTVFGHTTMGNATTIAGTNYPLDEAARGMGSLPPPHNGKGYVLREAPSNHRQPPTLLPVDSQARKDIPLFDFLRGYFPRAFIELARFSKVANDKWNPGEPMHWSKGKSTDHLNCVGRHLLEVGDKDEFGFWHDVALFWRAGANLEIRLEAEAMGISYEELLRQYTDGERA